MSSFFREAPSELRWYSIDLDDTIAESVWPDPGIGEPIWDNLEKLMLVWEKGYKIIINTARHWGDYLMIEEWLIENNIPYDMIICGKPLVHRIVDDKAIPADRWSWL